MAEFSRSKIIPLSQTPNDKGDPPGPGVIRTNKFIIIAAADELILVYGPVAAYPYHAGLLKAWCDINEVPSGWVKKPDLYEILDDSYQVRGGGWLEENLREKQLGFYGSSSAYGGFDPADINYIYNLQPASGYKLLFGD